MCCRYVYTCFASTLYVHAHLRSRCYAILVHVLQMNGVPFVIDGRTQHFRGTVSIISADNPASASLGGFKQSSSAFRFCRHCMGAEDDIQNKVNM